MTRAYVALGSNLGDRSAALAEATRRLARLPHVHHVIRSSVVETKALLPPEDPTPQPDYLNAVVACDTELSSRELFDALKAIERAMGRAPGPRWAPRIIDLDLLFFGDAVVHEADLAVPHPELHRRAFVLVPLSELAPDLVHPTLQRTVAQLLEALPAQR